ncbi:NAD-dependent epimerase [Peijinzhouia sedimentorum]
MIKKVLVTGAAGFIGFHTSRKLLDRGDEVVGLDSINDYYDPMLKKDRLIQLGIDPKEIEYNVRVYSSKYPKFSFIRLQLEDKHNLEKLFQDAGIDHIINLAAQAGVRHSLTHPEVYMQSNILGFCHILEMARHFNVKHLVYASSSSVYGQARNIPFSTMEHVDFPVSLYAASKKANELMAHTYSHIFRVPTTGLRFFTVYGPWGRPDMALFIFTKKILAGEPIDVYNYGDMRRDFTYVDDIVEGITRVLDKAPTKNPHAEKLNYAADIVNTPYMVYNIGNSSPVRLMDFIEEIEEQLGKKAIKNLMPIQPGDIALSYADASELEKDLGYRPKTTIRDGVTNFLAWYREYFKEA